MKLQRVALVLPVIAMIAGTSVRAADIARLEWGGFVVENDSSDGWDAFKSLSSDDGNSVKLTFASLDAKADGATMEASANLSGHYDLSQPKDDRVAHLVATIEGHVIKSGAAVTRLVLTIGSEQKTIEWPSGTNASEKFKRDIEIPVSAEGRLPAPFEVKVETYAKKEGASDAAYLSIDTLTITAAGDQVAGY